MSFSFNTSRVVPVGAIEAQPADNKGAIVQQFPAQPSGSGEVVDSLLLLADGGALTVEIGVWDTTGETDQWIVVAAKSLADGVPLVIPFPYTGERGVQVYCRATVAPAANVTLRMKQISGGAAPIEVSLAGMATEAKQDANIDAIEALQSATVYKYYAAFAADTDLVTDGGGLCRRIIVGTSGTLVITKNDDTDETLPAEICTDGAVLDIRAKAIKNTSTATKVLVMW